MAATRAAERFGDPARYFSDKVRAHCGSEYSDGEGSVWAWGDAERRNCWVLLDDDTQGVTVLKCWGRDFGPVDNKDSDLASLYFDLIEAVPGEGVRWQKIRILDDRRGLQAEVEASFDAPVRFAEPQRFEGPLRFDGYPFLDSARDVDLAAVIERIKADPQAESVSYPVHLEDLVDLVTVRLAPREARSGVYPRLPNMPDYAKWDLAQQLQDRQRVLPITSPGKHENPSQRPNGPALPPSSGPRPPKGGPAL